MQTLLEVLVELHGHVEDARMINNYNPTTFHGFTGICSYVPHGKLKAELNDLIKKWPLTTSDWEYPVPAHRGDTSPCNARDAYIEASNARMWFVGEYAELRMELLNWMIKELQDEIDLPI